MNSMHWDYKKSLYIGDSINDLDAANTCNIDFLGFNSGITDWSQENVFSVDSFEGIERYLT